ncbi:hypothetical protein CcrC1_gp406 [Caulobacter phage C1]|nr:hypothetical protein CcrC1_gp406 [Caulobacter phage C1]UTU08635.1 hypothetical protein CcrC2_gp407 [Caulobacter phage C2]UTU09150.1 hypothetical protein CcrJ4_gp401 [Caulobacter phage J4]UTU10267.1 hypothetical protein CcrRB23_gp405 [Caulobacter phage RB23]WGN97301.1 hypothetical protein [Bertelyvirus sp.]
MQVQHISLKGGLGDARNEQFQRLSPMVPAGVPSPNLQAIITNLESGKLGTLRVLADKIENGAATEDEAELDALYDGLPLLVAYVEDLIGMCLRREEALAECDVRVGRPITDDEV